MSNVAEMEKLKVSDLKAALKAKGLNTVGNKKQLLERLLEASSKSETMVDNDDDEVNEDLVLGEGDETIDDDQKSGDLFINEEVILSPVKLKPINIKSNAPEKENKEITAAKSETFKDDDDDGESTAKISPTAIRTLTEQERRELRAKRFNAPATDDNLKIARAERFGLALKGNGTVSKTDSGSTTTNMDKLKMRASRFGVVSATPLIKNEDKDRILKRKQRFGVGTSVGHIADDDETKRKRAERFGLK